MTATMPAPMNGHFIPKFFLRHFRAPDGNLWVYFHDDGWVRRGSADGAAKQDFYSPELEAAYQKVEITAADVLDKTVYDRKAPVGESRETLAYFLGLLQSRTPTFYENLPHPLSDIMNKITSLYANYYCGNAPEFERLKRDAAASGNPLPRWFKAEHMSPEAATKGLVSGTATDAAEISAGILNAMSWNFLTSSEEAPFITSDGPFVSSNVDGHPSGAGLLHANTEVTIPLSSTVALSAKWPNPEDGLFLAADENLVEEVNLRMIAASHKFIVASRPDFPGAKNLRPMVGRT